MICIRLSTEYRLESLGLQTTVVEDQVDQWIARLVSCQCAFNGAKPTDGRIQRKHGSVVIKGVLGRDLHLQLDMHVICIPSVESSCSRLAVRGFLVLHHVC